MVVAVGILGMAIFDVLGNRTIVVVFMFALAAHLLASAYMAFAKCPQCDQRFSRRTLLSFVSSLEDQATSECQSCGISLAKTSTSQSNISLQADRER